MAKNLTLRARTKGVPYDATPDPLLKLVWSSDNPDAPATLERGAAQHTVALYRGYMYFNNQQYKKAIDAFLKAIEIKPDFPEAYYDLGISYIFTEELPAAIAAFHKTLEIKPDFALACCGLGAAYARSGQQWPDVIASFEKAVKIEPGLAVAYCSLGSAYSVIGDFPAAFAAVEVAIELKPDLAEAYLALGTISSNAALDIKPDFATVYRTIPATPTIYGGLVVGNRQVERLVSDAVAAFRRAIELKPDLAITYKFLGGLLAQTNQIPDAIAALRKVVELDPKDSDARENVAQMLAKLPDAIAVCRKEIEKFPDDAKVHLKLGRMLAEIGQFKDAVAACRKAREVEPNIETQRDIDLFIEEYLNKDNGIADQTIEPYNQDDLSGTIMNEAARAIFKPAADLLGLPVEVLWEAGQKARAEAKAAARSVTRRAKAKPRPKAKPHPTRPQFRERTGYDLKLSPPEFIKIAYAPEIAAKTLHKGLIHREDAGLYTDLHNWLRDPENKIPHDLDLPTFKEWNSRRLADPATREAMRLREVEKGRMKAGEAQRPVGRPRKADRQAVTG